jgi:hypothetical protein
MASPQKSWRRRGSPERAEPEPSEDSTGTGQLPLGLPVEDDKGQRTPGLKRRKAMFADVITQAGDAYHWLKYGEKLLRDRKTLRHYYRCGSRADTGCCAKKMVDVLVTSGACTWHYREAHNHGDPTTATHPLPANRSALKTSNCGLDLQPSHCTEEDTNCQEWENPTATLAAALLAVQRSINQHGDGPLASGDVALMPHMLHTLHSSEHKAESRQLSPSSMPNERQPSAPDPLNVLDTPAFPDSDQFAATLAACLALISGTDSP